MHGSFLKRASIFGALFFLATPTLAANPCGSQQTPDWHTVGHVYDGDSLRLTDRRKIRLIGVNTPEMAMDERPIEPFAQAAREFVESRINDAQQRVGLIYGTSRKDRYGRTLAHIILPDQTNLSAQLLLNGLGSHIAIAPNLGFNDCYAEAQQIARKNKRGIWLNANQLIYNLDADDDIPTGFRHVRGTVSRIGESRGNLWLNFGEKLAIRISRKDLDYFTQWQPASLLHQNIEASGWVYTRKGHLRMRVYHPSVIRRYH